MRLFEVEALTVGITGSPFPILREVSFYVEPGEVLALVGESGSGKTMTALAAMGLLPFGIEMTGGDVRLEGDSLVRTGGTVERSAAQMSMIFQHPTSALNPTMRVGHQVGRVIQINQRLGRTQSLEAAVELLKHVGIPGAKRVARNFPHQLSGGMCQRVMIAMAVACQPRLLIADEPTTALDVTVQAQIFDLIKSLVSEIGCGVLFITHDLGAVAEMADRVAVLREGRIVQVGTPEQVYETPADTFVARFVGPLPMNLLARDDGHVGIRPEHVRIGDDLDARVERVEHAGTEAVVHTVTERGPVVLRLPWGERPAVGDDVRLGWAPAHLHAFDRDGRRLAR